MDEYAFGTLIGGDEGSGGREVDRQRLDAVGNGVGGCGLPPQRARSQRSGRTGRVSLGRLLRHG